MKARYIAIEREYGSGGTEIARRVAEETGVPCYGREIIEAVAQIRNLSVDDIEKYEENVKNSFLYSIYLMGQSNLGNSDLLSKEGHIFITEQEQIRKMAKSGRAIFLGHCASEALRTTENVVRVFIRCSSPEEKRKRIMESYGIPEASVDSTGKHNDRRRANYYNANTGRKWDDLKNYDMVLDSGTLGIDGCVAALKGLFAD